MRVPADPGHLQLDYGSDLSSPDCWRARPSAGSPPSLPSRLAHDHVSRSHHRVLSQSFEHVTRGVHAEYRWCRPHTRLVLARARFFRSPWRGEGGTKTQQACYVLAVCACLFMLQTALFRTSSRNLLVRYKGQLLGNPACIGTPSPVFARKCIDHRVQYLQLHLASVVGICDLTLSLSLFLAPP